MRDLFGREISVEEARRIVKRRDPAPAGYAAPPGSGPAGETCRSCRHLWRAEYSRAYLKCELMAKRWTHGRKTDVLASAPACSKWEVGRG